MSDDFHPLANNAAQLQHARACAAIKRWSERLGCAAPEAFEQAVQQCARELTALCAAERELAPLAQRIAKGRAKYANGCTILSLIDEAGEVAHAVNKYESADRIRDELLDVAAVAMRLYFGEIDRGLEMDGLVQRRREECPVGRSFCETGNRCLGCSADRKRRDDE